MDSIPFVRICRMRAGPSHHAGTDSSPVRITCLHLLFTLEEELELHHVAQRPRVSQPVTGR